MPESRLRALISADSAGSRPGGSGPARLPSPALGNPANLPAAARRQPCGRTREGRWGVISSGIQAARSDYARVRGAGGNRPTSPPPPRLVRLPQRSLFLSSNLSSQERSLPSSCACLSYSLRLAPASLTLSLSGAPTHCFGFHASSESMAAGAGQGPPRPTPAGDREIREREREREIDPWLRRRRRKQLASSAETARLVSGDSSPHQRRQVASSAETGRLISGDRSPHQRRQVASSDTSSPHQSTDVREAVTAS